MKAPTGSKNKRETATILITRLSGWVAGMDLHEVVQVFHSFSPSTYTNRSVIKMRLIIHFDAQWVLPEHPKRVFKERFYRAQEKEGWVFRSIYHRLMHRQGKTFSIAPFKTDVSQWASFKIYTSNRINLLLPGIFAKLKLLFPLTPTIPFSSQSERFTNNFRFIYSCKSDG